MCWRAARAPTRGDGGPAQAIAQMQDVDPDFSRAVKLTSNAAQQLLADHHSAVSGRRQAGVALDDDDDGGGSRLDATAMTATAAFGVESGLEFGYIPARYVEGLAMSNSWQIRSSSLEEVLALTTVLTDATVIVPHLYSLLSMLATVLEDSNFKVSITAIQIVEAVVGAVGARVRPSLDAIVPALVEKLSDNKIVIRHAVLKAMGLIMHVVGHRSMLPLILPHIRHRNRNIRISIIELLILCVLTITRGRTAELMDLPFLISELAALLMDVNAKVRGETCCTWQAACDMARAQVRSAAMELFAAIKAVLPDADLLGMVTRVDDVDLPRETVVALQERLASGVVPTVNANGVVELPGETSGFSGERSLSGASKELSNAGSTPVMHGNSNESNVSAVSATMTADEPHRTMYVRVYGCVWVWRGGGRAYADAVSSMPRSIRPGSGRVRKLDGEELPADGRVLGVPGAFDGTATRSRDVLHLHLTIPVAGGAGGGGALVAGEISPVVLVTPTPVGAASLLSMSVEVTPGAAGGGSARGGGAAPKPNGFWAPEPDGTSALASSPLLSVPAAVQDTSNKIGLWLPRTGGGGGAAGGTAVVPVARRPRGGDGDAAAGPPDASARVRRGRGGDDAGDSGDAARPPAAGSDARPPLAPVPAGGGDGPSSVSSSVTSVRSGIATPRLRAGSDGAASVISLAPTRYRSIGVVSDWHSPQGSGPAGDDSFWSRGGLVPNVRDSLSIVAEEKPVAEGRRPSGGSGGGGDGGAEAPAPIMQSQLQVLKNRRNTRRVNSATVARGGIAVMDGGDEGMTSPTGGRGRSQTAQSSTELVYDPLLAAMGGAGMGPVGSVTPGASNPSERRRRRRELYGEGGSDEDEDARGGGGGGGGAAGRSGFLGASSGGGLSDGGGGDGGMQNRMGGGGRLERALPGDPSDRPIRPSALRLPDLDAAADDGGMPSRFDSGGGGGGGGAADGGGERSAGKAGAGDYGAGGGVPVMSRVSRATQARRDRMREKEEAEAAAPPSAAAAGVSPRPPDDDDEGFMVPPPRAARPARGPRDVTPKTGVGSGVVFDPPSVRSAPAGASEQVYIASEDLPSCRNPEAELRHAMEDLASGDWEKNFAGLNRVRALSRWHASVLAPATHSVVLAVVKACDNLRSSVCKNALLALGDMLAGLGRTMDAELDVVVAILVKKATDTNA